jgi:hypothetical protein
MLNKERGFSEKKTNFVKTSWTPHTAKKNPETDTN